MQREICFGTLMIVSLMAAQVWGQDTASPEEIEAVPRLVRFSGTLREVGERPARGAVEMSFSLFQEESGGEPLWFETQTVEVDAQGRYNVLLGAMHAGGLPMDLFTSGEARWLEVMVGKSAQPRVLLVSVPYALKAGDAATLGGKPASAYALQGQTTTAVVVAGTASSGETTQASLTQPGTQPALVTTGQTHFTDTTADYVVRITQNGAGRGLSSLSQSGEAVYGQIVGAAGTTYGVRGITPSTTGAGVFGSNTATTGAAYGVRGNSSSTGGAGVAGFNTATTGSAFGIIGQTSSTAGVALYGRALAATGATVGLQGVSDSTSGFGINALASANSGATTGLLARANSASGTAAVLYNEGGGKILSGRTTGSVEKFSVDGNGNLTTAGVVTAVSFVGSGSGLTGVGDILGITTAAGSGLQGGATSGTPSLSLLTSCGANQVLKYVSATWQCADDNITVSPSALIRGINYLAGCDSCTALADTDDQQDFFVNVIGPLTVLSVACYTDGGTPSINVQRDDGSPGSILASNLTCTTGGATGTIDTNEDNIAVGEKLDFVLSSAGGAKRITLVIKATL